MLVDSTRKHTVRRTKKKKKKEREEKSCQLYFAVVVPSYDGNAVAV